MNIIKLDATASTNTYLREMLTSCDLENFTTVVTENQFAGKGQRGEKWVSEAGSNLTFSVLIKNSHPLAYTVFDVNIMVALSLLRALKKRHNLPFFIKWPNDILSANKKICGILIENVLKSNGTFASIVGIGINVNQLVFDGNSKASSLSLLLGKKVDKELILHDVLAELKTGFACLEQGNGADLWVEYKKHLYRKGMVSVFETPGGNRFNGIIRDVTAVGKLVVETNEEQQVEFALKEVKLLY